jgi:hypothetical protein
LEKFKEKYLFIKYKDEIQQTLLSNFSLVGVFTEKNTIERLNQNSLNFGESLAFSHK